MEEPLQSQNREDGLAPALIADTLAARTEGLSGCEPHRARRRFDARGIGRPEERDAQEGRHPADITERQSQAAAGSCVIAKPASTGLGATQSNDADHQARYSRKAHDDLTMKRVWLGLAVFLIAAAYMAGYLPEPAPGD